MNNSENSNMNPSAFIELNKPLNVSNSVEIKNILFNAIGDSDTLIIRHRDIENMDLSYIQILAASAKYGETVNKKILLENPDDENFQKSLKDSGFHSNKILQKLFRSHSDREDDNG